MKNAGNCMNSGVFVMPKSVLNFRREKGIFPVRKGARMAMKVSMMMRDTEYRDALAGRLSETDRDLLIEVAGAGGAQRGSVILTDISPSEIESKSLERIRNRTLFLSPVKGSGSDGSGCRVIFKYSSISTIISELALLYSEWTGNTGSIISSSRIISVICESDLFSSERCTRLAGQIVYTHGGRILILPLGYINDYLNPAGADSEGWFRRLMYIIDQGRKFPPDGFTYTDSYGVSYLRLPEGINPVAELTESYLTRLVSSLGACFDTIILDAGSCFRKANLHLISGSDAVLFFGTGRRVQDISPMLGTDERREIRKITTSDIQREARELDDFVNDIYGRTDQKRNDP